MLFVSSWNPGFILLPVQLREASNPAQQVCRSLQVYDMFWVIALGKAADPVTFGGGEQRHVEMGQPAAPYEHADMVW